MIYLVTIHSKQLLHIDWNHKETFESLVRKAGYQGSVHDITNLQVTRYESCKGSLLWNDYLTLRSSKLQNNRSLLVCVYWLCRYVIMCI